MLSVMNIVNKDKGVTNHAAASLAAWYEAAIKGNKTLNIWSSYAGMAKVSSMRDVACSLNQADAPKKAVIYPMEA